MSGGRSRWVQVTCSYCGRTFEMLDTALRERLKRSQSGNLYCDSSCFAMSQMGTRRVLLPPK